MMWRAHLTSGVAGGLWYSMVLDLPLVMVPPVVALTAIGSLTPDIDCPGSTASRSIPLLTPALSWIVRNTSKIVYNLTRGPRDEDWAGTHRHLSHTVLFALGLGAALYFLTAPWLGVNLGLVLGGAFAIGCVIHDLGDSLTIMGCPFLWPLPIAGETWYEIRPPRLLRFRTGGFFETYVMIWLLRVTAVLLVPGVWPIVRDYGPPAMTDVALLIWTLVQAFTGT